MQTITVRTVDLTPHPRNYNEHGARQIEHLARSLTTFGQFKNIVVARRHGRLTVVAGHGLVEAARQAGVAELEAKVAPDDWPDEMLDALLVADNRLAQLAEPDEAALADLLRTLRLFDESLLEAVGFDGSEIDELLLDAARAGEPPPDIEFREVDESIASEVEFHECPNCGHRWPK